MTFQVKLTDEAKGNYKNIKEYLMEEFGEKVVFEFKQILEHCILLMSQNPHLFPVFEQKKEIRRAVIIKKVSLYYLIVKEEVHILSIINNRRESPTF